MLQNHSTHILPFAAKAEQWATKRKAQAGISWHNYGLGAEQGSRVVIIAPPKIDVATGEITSENYTLDLETRTCSCGDQLHIDRLIREARKAGEDISQLGLTCKHFPIWCLLVGNMAGFARPTQPQPAPVVETEYRFSLDEIAERAARRAAEPWSDSRQNAQADGW